MRGRKAEVTRPVDGRATVRPAGGRRAAPGEDRAGRRLHKTGLDGLRIEVDSPGAGTRDHKIARGGRQTQLAGRGTRRLDDRRAAGPHREIRMGDQRIVARHRAVDPTGREPGTGTGGRRPIRVVLARAAAPQAVRARAAPAHGTRAHAAPVRGTLVRGIVERRTRSGGTLARAMSRHGGVAGPLLGPGLAVRLAPDSRDGGHGAATAVLVVPGHPVVRERQRPGPVTGSVGREHRSGPVIPRYLPRSRPIS